METSRPLQVMLPPPQHLQQPKRPVAPSQTGRIQHGRMKTLSVGQALQYTPLTTSVLPAHDRILVPHITRPKESAKFTSSAERKSVQHILAQYPSNKVKERLQGLLQPDTLPEYKFNQVSIVNDSRKLDSQTVEQMRSSLSLTAKLIFDTTAIDYKCSSPSKPIPPNQPISTVKIDPPTFNAITPQMVRNVKSGIDGVLPGSNGKMPSITKSSSQTLSINLPKPLQEHKTAVVAIDQGSPKRRKLSQNESLVRVSLHVRSQRDAADAALQQFQNVLMEVFEAQDQLDAGSTAVYDTGFFEQNEDSDDSEPKLTTRIMDTLLGHLKKLVTMNKVSDLSTDHLRRLQVLCEAPIDRVQTMNLKFQPDADFDELRQWKQNVSTANNGLLAGAILLHTVLGTAPDDSLLTTEALAWIPSALRNVFENCLIPFVEARPDDSSSEFFRTAAAYKDDVKKLLETSRKLLDVVSTACVQVRGLENVVNPTEFLAAKIIFVQNATVDKTSIPGIQTFEKVRKTAMSTLARIFAHFPAERSAILDEVLTSLDKLPSNSRSARQYRLGNGKSIQLISALFVQLIQNTALETPKAQSTTGRKAASKRLEQMHGVDNDDEIGENEITEDEDEADQHSDALTKLKIKADRLFDAAARSAQEIVLYLVGRASKTTKTGDSPYRNLLDLFIEDMVTVLTLPEWPASELMLRIMAAKMTDMAHTEKTASAKNMALESLGLMGSAISTLKASLPRQCSAMIREGRPSSMVAEHLSKLANEHDKGGIRNEELVAFNGPFAIVSRHLWTEADQGLRNLSACGFFLAQYAKFMSLVVDASTFNENDIEAEPVRVANFLLETITQIGSGTTTMHNFDAVSSEEAELAYSLSVLNMGFCRKFTAIVKTLSSSLSSDQAQVRSRSLKSVVTMLETDSTLLDREPTIADDVFKCASDDSAIVRDSALSLIARFIIARPALEQKGIQRLLECASDAKIGVQKRAIGHLRDIYIKDNRPNLKSTISRVILKRTTDHEDTVAELAKKTMVEIWITPVTIQLSQSADLAMTKVAVDDLTTDIVNCISPDPTALCPFFRKFLKGTLSGDAKSTGKARELCCKIIEVLFERTISNQDERGPLMVLTSFAEADPLLIPPSNLSKLQPYLGNLKSENDLFVFKAVISIFANILPHLSTSHKPLLLETQNALMKAISSLGRRTELDTVMSCLHVIDGVLQNTMRLIKLAGSILVKIKAGALSLAKSTDIAQQVIKLLRIAGALARHIDLEKYWQQFAQEVKDMKGRSVAGYIANAFLPLTQASQPTKVRLLALESLGSLCQAFPAQLNQKPVQETFFSILPPKGDIMGTADQDSLLFVVLKVFEELYADRAKSKEGNEDADEDEEKQELGKMGGDSRTRDGDSAISMITGSVARSALAVALSAPNENALVATRTLASISHQGLNHPKQSLLAFVALGTCPDFRIAEVAHAAHRLLHQQHESVCEREYMTAIHEAFEYQRKVLNDSHGARLPNYQAKLSSCFEIVNGSGPKYVKKFLSGLISRITAKLSSEDGMLPVEQVLWTLFAVQNLVFFDFTRADEVLHVILQLELAYSKKGVEISQLLEAALAPPKPFDVPLHLENAQDFPLFDDPLQLVPEIDMETIERLAPLAATLTILMEARSYLKRQYGVGRDVRMAISQNKQAKDSVKPPSRVYGITGEKFWTKSNAVIAMLDGEAGKVSCCQYFVDLMSMDDEINVNDEDPFRDASDSVGPVQVPVYVRSSTPSGGMKRKLSASATSTPAKRGPGRPKRDTKRSASVSSAGDHDEDYMM